MMVRVLLSVDHLSGRIQKIMSSHQAETFTTDALDLKLVRFIAVALGT